MVANIHETLGDRALDGGSDLCVAQLAPGIAQGQLQLLEIVGRFGVGLFADQLLLPQIGLALVLALGLGELAFDPRHLGALRLVLKADQELPLGDVVPLLHQQPGDLPLGLGEHLDLVLGLQIRGETQERLDSTSLQGNHLDRDGLFLVLPLTLVVIVLLLVLLGVSVLLRVRAAVPHLGLVAAARIVRPIAGSRESHRQQ